jgi:hypothetical protein
VRPTLAASDSDSRHSVASVSDHRRICIDLRLLRARFNVFYPHMDARGGREVGYVETGLELLDYLVALLWKVTGVHVGAGRLLSSLLFLASV